MRGDEGDRRGRIRCIRPAELVAVAGFQGDRFRTGDGSQSLDRRTSDLPALGPGKRTLVEELGAAGAATGGGSAASSAAQPSGPINRTGTATARPADADGAAAPQPVWVGSIQRLFGREAAEGTAHAAASQGVATPASPLPFSDTIQRAFGRHDVSSVQAHTGSAAAASAHAMGADAYATGNHVILGRAADLHTVAHEAAHVVQQRGGVQLKGGVGAAGDAYERHADAVADAVVAGGSAEQLLDGGATGGAAHAIQRKETPADARILHSQASLTTADVEIPVLEGALLSTRKEAVKRGLLSQASFDAGLALSQAMTQLQPVVAAHGAVDKGLQDRAALAAHQLFGSLQRETADDKNFQVVPTMDDSAAIASHNPYTDETKVTTSFLLWATTHDMGSWFQRLPGLIRQGAWSDAFQGYRRMLDGLDLWVADQLRRKGNGTPEQALGNAQQHYAQLRTGLEQIADKHATRLPALFHPDPKTVASERAEGRPAADTVPMNVYFWKDDKDGKHHLYDLTTPSRPHEQTIDGQPTAAIMTTFFEEVARYPEGEVRYTLPGGAAGVAATTGKTKWYEWIGYAGLAVAAVGLGLLTAGASVAATVCFATGAIAGGISAGGHLADTEQLGTATSATIVLDVAQIIASLASFGAMAITVRAGSAAAALAGSRWFVPLVGSAAGADAVQLVALTDITFTELNKIQNGAGTPEDKQRAMAVLLAQLMVVSGLTALSVQGARSARSLARSPLELVDQDGKTVLRVVGDTSLSGKQSDLPKSWDKFDPTANNQFKTRLKNFRGGDNLNPDYAGGEGRIFAADGKLTALKRWFEVRLGDMPASLSKLRQVKADVESHPRLGADIEVVQIHEQGPDWILRDFDPNSVELKAGPTEAQAARGRAIVALEALESKGSLTAMLADLLKKLKKQPPSANLHWSPSKGKILVIDMQ